ncbi:MAG: hypothetical protein LBU40_02190, partial [Methanobrevibacter sp.]|nr:hypothetical protein [Methanobrevibacter sp.]
EAPIIPIDFEKLIPGKNIIFNYKGDSYLSKIFEINNDLLKVKYKGQFQWIEKEDIKKLLS